MNKTGKNDKNRGPGFVPIKGFKRLANRHLESNSIESKVTLMMFTISVAHVISFIPYLIHVVNLWIKQKGSSEQEFNAGTQIALRSYMLTNAINPYIFGFLIQFSKLR